LALSLDFRCCFCATSTAKESAAEMRSRPTLPHLRSGVLVPAIPEEKAQGTLTMTTAGFLA
jgi:hypothetical protein